MNLYIACLDLTGKVQIKCVEVKGINKDKQFKLTEKLTGIKSISPMHWDAVCKSIGKKTLPTVSAGDNWERGYVFYNRIDAMKRLENYIEKLEDQAILQLEKVAVNKARLENLKE